jgi:hypothetical protein
MKFLALTTVLLLASTVARADSFDIRSLESLQMDNRRRWCWCPTECTANTELKWPPW